MREQHGHKLQSCCNAIQLEFVIALRSYSYTSCRYGRECFKNPLVSVHSESLSMGENETPFVQDKVLVLLVVARRRRTFWKVWTTIDTPIVCSGPVTREFLTLSTWL